MATYAKGLARRASLTKGSAKATKDYKAKVAFLTSERAGLRAQIRDLAEELVKHRSDLKHASTARVRAEDREKKARKDAKVAEDELQLAREEVHAGKGDLCAKVYKTFHKCGILGSTTCLPMVDFQNRVKNVYKSRSTTGGLSCLLSPSKTRELGLQP